MLVVDGKLTDPGRHFELEHAPRAVPLNRPVIVPRVVVIHYAVTHTYEETRNVGVHSKAASWHLSVEGKKVAQHIDFDRRAGHAGKSSWRGEGSVNDFSVGIEIANPGPLRKGADGKFRDTTSRARVWNGLVERHEAFGYEYWAGYSDDTVDTILAIVSALAWQYDIKDIVGHSDIAPGRKIDPGPAFPLELVRTECLAGPRTASK